MTFVIDASMAVTWFLRDEDHPAADGLLRKVYNQGAYVPDLFWHEMRNVLLICYRRQRLSFEDVFNSMEQLSTFPITTSAIEDSGRIVTLAETHRLTAYDSAYLALALETRMPLATLDKQLATAASKAGVPLLA